MENGGFEPMPRPSGGTDTSRTNTEQIPTNIKQINVLSDSVSSRHKHESTLPKHEKDTSLHAECVTCVQQNLSDDLREVIDTWEHIPDAVKVGILAMIRAAKQI